MRTVNVQFSLPSKCGIAYGMGVRTAFESYDADNVFD